MTDRQSLSGTPDHSLTLQLEKIEQAAKAGMDWIQIREKDLPGRDLAKLTQNAILLAGGSSAVFVNDRVDVACVAGASGVHLGEHGLPADQARRLMSQRCQKIDFIVGFSAHSLDQAVQAEQAGADYVIFGPVYTTPSKASFGQPQGLQRLREVCRRLAIPVLAIGGITLKNTQQCFAAGAGGIAAIRLFQDTADLEAVVKELRKLS